MTVVSMSQQELSRFDTVLRVERRELRPEDAASLLGISRRQVFRLLDRLRSDGAEGLVSGKRGKPSNRRLSDAFRQQVVALVRAHYADFGPTLAAEYLAERHDVRISHESLRKLMIDVGLWKDRQARRPRPYQPRYRRDCRGELVQIDGSKHWWLEERGPQTSLLVFIDDATSPASGSPSANIPTGVSRSSMTEHRFPIACSTRSDRLTPLHRSTVVAACRSLEGGRKAIRAAQPVTISMV